jgi:hypothetical protein
VRAARLETELIAAQAQVQAMRVATARTDEWLRSERATLESQATQLLQDLGTLGQVSGHAGGAAGSARRDHEVRPPGLQVPF